MDKRFAPRVPMGPKERRLRSYTCVAQRQYYCDRCHQNIEPGEMYEATVWSRQYSASVARARGMSDHRLYLIHTEREHTEPPCHEWDPTDDEWAREWLEDEVPDDLAQVA